MVQDAAIDLNACRFTGNQGSGSGGALYGGDHAELVLTACTLAWNRSPVGGGLVLIFQGAATLSNCIIAHSLEGEGIGLPWPGPVVDLNCSDLYGNAGGDWLGDLAEQLGQDGNISADPHFCGDAGDGDVNLRTDSPCLAAQSGCGDMGALQVGCSSRSTRDDSWSRVKSYY
jgi:predicted outer membrane repeat protein